MRRSHTRAEVEIRYQAVLHLQKGHSFFLSSGKASSPYMLEGTSSEMRTLNSTSADLNLSLAEQKKT